MQWEGPWGPWLQMPSGNRGQPGKGLPEEVPALTAAPLQMEVFFTRSQSLIKQIIGGHRMTHSLRALSHLPALPSSRTPTWRLTVPSGEGQFRRETGLGRKGDEVVFEFL